MLRHSFDRFCSHSLAQLSAHKDKLVGVAEQLLSSATSMLGLIILSRMMSIDDYGIVAMSVGIWLIIEMIQSSMTIGPFVLTCPNPTSKREGFGAWVAFNFLFAAVLAIGFIGAGFALRSILPAFSYALMLSAPLCFWGALYMFLRRLHYHRMSRGLLIIQTSAYSLAYLGLIAVLYFKDVTPSVLEGAMVQIAAFALPTLIMSYPSLRDARFRLGSMHEVWAARKLVFEMGAAGFIWQLPYTITLLALGIFSSPAAVAIFTVTRTLVRPITLVMATLSDVDVSKASRAFDAQGLAGLMMVVRSNRRALWLLTIVPVALLIVFPGFFLSLVYGEQYAGATLEMQLRATLFLPLIYVAPLEMALTVLRDARYLLNVFVFSLAVCFLYLVAAYVFGAIDAASALASLVVARLAVIPLVQRRLAKHKNQKTSDCAQKQVFGTHG